MGGKGKKKREPEIESKKEREKRRIEEMAANTRWSCVRSDSHCRGGQEGWPGEADIKVDQLGPVSIGDGETVKEDWTTLVAGTIKQARIERMGKGNARASSRKLTKMKVVAQN